MVRRNMRNSTAKNANLGGLERDPEAGARAAFLLTQADVAVGLFTMDGRPLHLNMAARDAGFAAVPSLRDKFAEAELFDDLLIEANQRGSVRRIVRLMNARSPSWHDITFKLCRDPETDEDAILVSSLNVDALKKAHDQAELLADRDQLTGCYNRAFFTRRIDEVFQPEATSEFAMVYFDLDRFKYINDTFGHEAGDAILCAASQRIRRVLPGTDMLARMGGDEFVITLMDVSDREELTRICERVRATMAEPVEYEKSQLNVSFSMGATTVPAGAKDPDKYLRQADIALYVSKQAGRDRCTIYTEEMGYAANERSRLENDLRKALKRDEFVLYFQPRVDARTGQVVSAEALVRWQHPARGIVQPGSFIPLCEETGMIADLGHIVLKKGFDQLCNWQHGGLDIGISINVSPRQFMDERFLKTLDDLSRSVGFPEGMLELEITERVLIGDHDVISSRLRRISELGFQIAIDDFGTGYSNLTHISRFPLDCLKIDRSFVSALPTSGPIVRLIRTLSEKIGARTVAEGVEEEGQAQLLRDIGCEQFQGFHYSKPVPAKQFPSVAADINRRVSVLSVAR
ncbi:MAG: bifunctional diguanylate cyclase/phosphodiesterase [Pseudomonadota bacterium]